MEDASWEDDIKLGIFVVIRTFCVAFAIVYSNLCEWQGA